MAETEFHPVVNLPEKYWVHDFTRGIDSDFICPYPYSIGRYDELRPGMYETELFSDGRELHVGIDIGGPEGTPIHAFTKGIVHSFGVEKDAGGYGPVLVTKHVLSGREIFVLHGHLSNESITGITVGDTLDKGQIIGYMGSKEINGGWEPHVHIQISFEEPEGFNMPGVVIPEQREGALELYPDPRLILGPIY